METKYQVKSKILRIMIKYSKKVTVIVTWSKVMIVNLKMMANSISKNIFIH